MIDAHGKNTRSDASDQHENESNLDEQTSAIEKMKENETPSYISQIANVPPALPQGWVVRTSRSQPDYQYYFHSDSGKCQWDIPVVSAPTSQYPNYQNKLMLDTDQIISGVNNTSSNTVSYIDANTSKNGNNLLSKTATTGTGEVSHTPAPSGILKRKSAYSDTSNVTSNLTSNTSSTSDPISSSSALRSSMKRSRGSSSSSPKEVRVLHLLKKHNKSRRPSSWRKKKITISKDEAIQELQELISMLKEIEAQDDFKELRATFEELAKTESDCSSSKRGGDLGFFGKKKMQPAFEKASFALKVGQLSEIVETSSGVHVILRLG